MRAAIYARVSSEKQDVDLSISAQLKALREYAIRNGHELVREFVDEAESGKTADRPAFREMISMARRSQKPFDCILVWKYSRFARSRQDSIVFKTMLRKNGVRVVSINEPSDDTPTGKLFEAMIESLDEFYSANLGEEVTRGMRESASRGFYIGNFTPYGYRKVKVNDGNKERPKLVPEPHQAQIVARMFDEVLEGKGLKEILKGLNREGIAGPRGNEWIKTTVHGILTNEVYTGTLVWGRNSVRGLPPIHVENAWQAIVNKETFDNVQSLLKSRAPSYLHPKRTASHFLLSGIAKCGYCGKALIGHDAKNGQFTYYVCGTLLKKGAGSCPARYINGKVFERAVINEIKERIITDENLKDLVRQVNEEMDVASVEYRERLGTILSELEDTNKRLTRLYDALETNRLGMDDLAPRIQELRRRQVQLLSARAELEQKLSDRRVYLADMETVTHYVQDLRNLLDESPLMERKSFIRSFIKEARVMGAEVSLMYTIPMSPRRITGEELAVLPIVHYGGRYWT
ncbi:MAG: recombinase family protein [Dehalococcoidia bacterium]|nr:recombinase family protein [Dehalococcoidia bacterium]